MLVFVAAILAVGIVGSGGRQAVALVTQGCRVKLQGGRYGGDLCGVKVTAVAGCLYKRASVDRPGVLIPIGHRCQFQRASQVCIATDGKRVMVAFAIKLGHQLARCGLLEVAIYLDASD